LSQYYFCFVFLVTGMWNLSSLTRDGSHTPCTGRWNLNYRSFREVPTSFFEDSFAEYVILAWQLFSFVPLSILFCYLLFPTLVVKQSLSLNCCFFVSDKTFLSDCLKKKKNSFSWLHCKACGILVPWLGIEPRTQQHWTTRECPGKLFIMENFKCIPERRV